MRVWFAKVKPCALRVLVVDDNDLVRHAICGLLKSEADIDIVCEASNGSDAVRFAREHKPDLVVLDITMPLMNGFAAARLIKAESPDIQILVVSQFNSPPFIREAFSAGASGFVPKDEASTKLISEVRRITSKQMGAVKRA